MNEWKTLFLLTIILPGVITSSAVASEFSTAPGNLVDLDNQELYSGSFLHDKNASKDLAEEDTAPGVAHSADILAFYVTETQADLPSNLLIHLPLQILFSDDRKIEDTENAVRVFIFDSPACLTVSLYDCTDSSSPHLIGSFSVESASSIAAQDTFQRHQETATPITLASSIQGYLLEVQQQSLSQPLSSVMWEQDSTIYTISFLAEKRQNLLEMARSMANATPITAAVATQSPSIDNISLAVEPAEVAFVEPVSTETSHRYFTSAIFLQAQEQNLSDDRQEPSSPNDNDELPLPIPGDLEIDGEGQFPLGVIRPIPVLELSVNSSVFTNTTFNTTTITDSTVFQNGVALRGSPELGPDTRLTAGIGGGTAVFTTGDSFISLKADLGILQELGDRMSLGFGWDYRQVYAEDFGGFDDNISENSVQLSWNRIDQLERRLFLNSRYILRGSFAQEELQSRFSSIAGIGLSFSFTPRLQGLLDYQLTYNNFFDNPENPDPLSHLLGAQLNYQINRNFLIGGSVSYAFGEAIDLLNPGKPNNPTDPETLNNLSFGLYLQYNLPLLY